MACPTWWPATAPRSTRDHGGISGVVYGGLGAGLSAVTAGLRAPTAPASAPRLEESPRGRFVVAAVNGLIGDRLRDAHPELAITWPYDAVAATWRSTPRACVRRSPRRPATSSCSCTASARPRATGTGGRHETGGSYGERLAERGLEPGLPARELRAPARRERRRDGRADGRPGRRVAGRGPPDRARRPLDGRADHAQRVCRRLRRRPAWNLLVTDVVTLGTPHLGAPIARALTAGSSGLSLLPESAPFGRFLDHRSVGILDLRAGLPDDVRNLPHARYHLVAGTVTRSRRHPVGEVAGDLLVRYPSAVEAPEAETLHVRADHFDLLNHDDVYAAIRRWLTTAHRKAGAPVTDPRRSRHGPIDAASSGVDDADLTPAADRPGPQGHRGSGTGAGDRPTVDRRAPSPSRRSPAHPGERRDLVYELTSRRRTGHRAPVLPRFTRGTALLGPVIGARPATTPSSPTASDHVERIRPDRALPLHLACRVLRSGRTRGGCPWIWGVDPSRVGCVTDSSTDLTGVGHQMNGGLLVVRPRRPHLPAPAARADRLPRLRGARPERQRDLRPAAAALRGGPRRRHLPAHQLARRLGRRRHGDLRHDELHPQRRRHGRHGPGRLDGPVPALRRRQGQALRPAARADHDAPAVRRHGWLGLRHQDPGPAVPAHQEGALRADQPSTPGRRSTRSRPTPTATGGSPPPRPRTTASSTT